MSKKKIVNTEIELIVLMSLDKRFKWITREDDGDLTVWSKKPNKAKYNYWCLLDNDPDWCKITWHSKQWDINACTLPVESGFFACIKSTDKCPTSIRRLIDNSHEAFGGNECEWKLVLLPKEKEMKDVRNK